jgi:hypothetical protein
MTLSEWLAIPGNLQIHLAQLPGLNASLISNLANGKKMASLAVAIALDAATGGVIQAEEMCQPAHLHLLKWLRNSAGAKEAEFGYKAPRPPGAKPSGFFPG